jgi:UDP-N-acetylmuramyl pentapeptide phosphotransferase/UDP-N-acetylglucosamine-1-phosphate transferase
MTPGLLLAIVAGSAFIVSCLGTRVLVTLLQRGAVLDRPNERSLHTAPVPRGGGIAIVGTIAAVWAGLCAAGVLRPSSLVVVLDMAGLAAVSWIDDLRGLSPGVRLLAQFVAVAGGIVALPHGTVFQNWLPPGLDTVATALLWVWFVNLFNFMDGIDGMAGSEAVAIGLGLVTVVSFGVARDLGIAAPGAGIAAAALGFLVWNWAPARIFMGDVGSVPIDYVLGYLLCRMAVDGWWKAALILPLYFVADATLTLLRRLARGERVWEAHREHFYQRAVQRGQSHSAIVIRVIAANAVLVVCAWVAENISGFAGIAVAALTVALMLVALGREGRRA